MTKNENRINKLFEELVPTSGKADSLAGELVRATARIGYRFFNDGDMVNQGYGKETCNPAARFLIAKGNAEISSLTVALWEIFSEDAYEKVLDTLEGAVADYIKQNPDLRSQPTKDISSRQMDLIVLNRLGVKPDTPAAQTEPPSNPPSEAGPVLDMDGKTEEGDYSYNVLMKQLECMK